MCHLVVSEIKAELLELVDEKYRRFQSGLLPGINNVIGVRVPMLRSLAKKIAKKDWEVYLNAGCDDTYEEVMLQAMLIGYARMDMSKRKQYLDAFIPKVNNWAVCDCGVSTWKFMKNHRGIWYEYLMKQIAVGTEYSIRVAVVALINYFTDEKWIKQTLHAYDQIQSEGYYAKMAVAWGVSVCYVKFPEITTNFLENNHMDTFTQNKAIQKIRESYRVSKDKKEEVKKFKR